MKHNSISRAGFTLVELMVTMIIIGLITAMAIPSFKGFINGGRANDAQNNLLAIYSAQVSYFSENNAYYGAAVNTCDTDAQFASDQTAAIKTNLNVTIFQNSVDYCCNNLASTFVCYARINGGEFKLKLINSTPNLTGGYKTVGRNPICLDGSGVCP